MCYVELMINLHYVYIMAFKLMNELGIYLFIWTEKYLMHWQILSEYLQILFWSLDLLLIIPVYFSPSFERLLWSIDAVLYDDLFHELVFGYLFVGVYFDTIWISKVHGTKKRTCIQL